MVQNGTNGVDGAKGDPGVDGTKGDPGTDGTIGKSFYEAFIFKRSSSAVSAPTGGSFNFGNNTLTAPTGWSTTIPSGTNPLYVSTGLFSIQGDSGTDNSTTWTTPVIQARDGTNGTNGTNRTNGTNGNSVYQFNIYRRNATALTAAPTGGSYNFTSNTASAPTGWYTGIPDGTDPCYVSSTTASIARCYRD